MMPKRINLIAVLAVIFAFVMSSDANAQWRSTGGNNWFGWDNTTGLNWNRGTDGYNKISLNNQQFGDIALSPEVEWSNWGPSRVKWDVRSNSASFPWQWNESFEKAPPPVDAYGQPRTSGYNPVSGFDPNTGTTSHVSPLSGKEVFPTPGLAWWELPDGHPLVQYRNDQPVAAAEVKHGPDGPYQKPISVSEGLARLSAMGPPPEQASTAPQGAAPVAPQGAAPGAPSAHAAVPSTPVRGPWDHEAYIVHPGWERLPSGTTVFKLIDGRTTTTYVPGMQPVDAIWIFQGEKPMQKTLSKAEVTSRWNKLASSAPAPATSTTSGPAAPPTATASRPTIPADPGLVPVGSIIPLGLDRFGETAWWKVTGYSGGEGDLRANFAPPRQLPSVGADYSEWGQQFVVAEFQGEKYLVPKNS